MARLLFSIPALLSCVILVRILLRAGRVDLTAICLLIPALLLVRRRWALRIVQTALIAGAGVWLITMLQIAQMRQESGQPATRMIVILSSVAVWTLLSAVLLVFPRRGNACDISSDLPKA